MGTMLLKLILALLMVSEYTLTENVDCRLEKRCRISRTHRMKAADCYARDFKYFPKCLPNDVEVIEVSYNRIRKINSADLKKFKYLKFLYLADNLIFNLEDDTFKDMNDLTTLDLSLNAISKVPKVVFQLPSLKTLYLSQNRNINIIDALESAKPIISPLTQIDISYTTDEDNISEFPNFGAMPFLASLNISGNQYSNIKVKDIFGLCNLQVLANQNVSIDFGDDCECWSINDWLTSKKVKFVPFVCTVAKFYCTDQNPTEDDVAIYKQCKEIYEEIERENRVFKISIGLISAFIICVLALGLYFLVFRKKCVNSKKNKNNLHKNDDRNTGLLSNHPKSVPNEYIL